MKFIREYNEYGQIDRKDNFKIFILHFLSFVNIALTKIGIEGIDMHATMFDHLQSHVR